MGRKFQIFFYFFSSVIIIFFETNPDLTRCILAIDKTIDPVLKGKKTAKQFLIRLEPLACLDTFLSIRWWPFNIPFFTGEEVSRAGAGDFCAYARQRWVYTGGCVLQIGVVNSCVHELEPNNVLKCHFQFLIMQTWPGMSAYGTGPETVMTRKCAGCPGSRPADWLSNLFWRSSGSWPDILP